MEGDVISKILSWAGRLLVGFIVLMMLVIGLIDWLGPDAPAKNEQPAALDPAQVRKQQIQAAVNQGEANLVAHIKAHMGDPGSFELVSDRAIDAGDHVTMVMAYRGRNGFNALRLERVSATFDLQGNILTVDRIE